jgi:hypothetical protein
MNLGADPPEPKIKRQIAECSLSCRGRTRLSQMKIKTMHLALSPNLKICNSEVFEKWVGFYYLLALGSTGCVGTR